MTVSNASNVSGVSSESEDPVRNATPHNNKGDLFQSFDVSNFPVPGLSLIHI